MEINHTVLRNAQNKNSVAANAEVSVDQSAMLPPEISGNGGSALPPEIEELRKQISQGIAPTFRTEAQPTSDAASAHPLPQLDEPAIVKPELPDAVPSLQDLSAGTPPESLTLVMEELRKLAQAEKNASIASAPKVEAAPARKSEAPPVPSWMSKLTSGTAPATTSQASTEMPP